MFSPANISTSTVRGLLYKEKLTSYKAMNLTLFDNTIYNSYIMLHNYLPFCLTGLL